MAKHDSPHAHDALISDQLDEATSQDDTKDLLDDVVQHTEASAHANGIVVGTFVEMDDKRGPLVDFPLNPTGRPLPARSTVALTQGHAGRDVALMFEQNDARKPIVIGLMHEFKETMNVTVDGQVQEVTAENELLLRCGKSSILLRRDGKIIIKGENILSRARMTNKVKGGSIQLN